jgi:hypothetical protein
MATSAARSCINLTAVPIGIAAERLPNRLLLAEANYCSSHCRIGITRYSSVRFGRCATYGIPVDPS